MENGLFFPCLYSNQEIRLTNVPPLLSATSSRHFFLAILPQLHLFSLFLLIFLSHSALLFLYLFLLCLMCSLLSNEGNFHIESQPGSGDLDLTPHQSPCTQNENVFVCIGSSATNRCERSLPPENVVRVQCVGVDKPTGCVLRKINI